MSYSRKRTKEKLQAEANSVGLEVVGDGRDCTERLYRFLSCGHETYLKTGNVRLAVNRKQGNYTCRDCIADKHKIEADEAGLVFIGHGKTSYFRKYKFKSCGHEQEIGTPEVRKGNFSCQVCLRQKHEREAKMVGLELLSKKVMSRNRRLYRFKACGHEKEIRISDVRNNRFTCRVCNPKNSFDKEAKTAGLELIGPARNSHYRTYRFKSCGHEQEIAISAVRSGFFKCFTCGSTAHNQPSNLYVNVITMDGYSTVKVGIAKNLERRIAEYKLQRRCSINTALVISFSTGREARDSEFKVKRRFRDFIDPMAREVMSSNGHTECFLIEKFEEILEFCKKLKT